MTPQDYIVAIICAAVVSIVAYGGYSRWRDEQARARRSEGNTRYQGSQVPAE